MNKVVMVGNLTKDPEVRYSAGSQPVAIVSFSIAVSRRVKREGAPDADFFNCTAFGKTGEVVGKYFRKGVRIGISGRIENESWTDKEGQKRSGTKIMVEEIEFCEKKAEAAEEKPVDGGPPYDFMPTAADEELPFKF